MIKKTLITFCILILELSQSHFSLDIGDHLKNAVNKTSFAIPVDCEYYDSVSVGDDLTRNKNFRWGSFVFKGSIGSWHVRVKEKHKEQ